jgi:hypothetical protein
MGDDRVTVPETGPQPVEGRRTSIDGIGASVYWVYADDVRIGQVRPSPESRASRPLWVSYRLNDDGYLGPLGLDGVWEVPTRREAVERLERASR